MWSLDDTIVAQASPVGGAARGIVRLSGPAVADCLEALVGPAPPDAIERPTASRHDLRLPGLHSPLPCQVYRWPEGRSYTGQAVAEIHTLGSPPLIEAIVQAACRGGARLAERGEFTLRAFLAGRLDLTQAEAVLGVIDAADRRQLDVALQQLAGGLARPLAQLRARLVSLLAELEAGLDFPEEDIAFIDPATLGEAVADAADQVGRLVAQMQARHEARACARAILLGAPNTGKSSLFNALTERRGALVSDEPGTTRDWLVARIDLGGLECRLVDTAGVADVDEEIQRAAQQGTTQQAEQADLRVFCVDSTRPMTEWELARLMTEDPRRVVVLTKADAAASPTPLPDAIATSSRSGEGLDRLRARMREAILTRPGEDLGCVAGTAARSRHSLELCAECLERAGRLIEASQGEELVAAELRTGLTELGKVVGEVYTDEILEVIFSRFCVGK